MCDIGCTPYRVIKIKAPYFFQAHSQNSDQKPDFLNDFTKQTPQFLSTSNALLNGPETKTAKREQ